MHGQVHDRGAIGIFMHANGSFADDVVSRSGAKVSIATTTVDDGKNDDGCHFQ
jgi:hypothetical protein